MFICFDTIPACDGQTDRQADEDINAIAKIQRAALRCAVKIVTGSRIPTWQPFVSE